MLKKSGQIFVKCFGANWVPIKVLIGKKSGAISLKMVGNAQVKYLWSVLELIELQWEFLEEKTEVITLNMVGRTLS